MILQIIALFSCGTFFGAALYISIAQNPALLEAGVTAGEQFFPPMYKRAAPMQVILALAGFISAMIVWYQSMNAFWLFGALLLFSVIPITLIFIKPVNDVLLSAGNNPDSADTERLLKTWGTKHWWRTTVSGIAFMLYLVAILNS